MLSKKVNIILLFILLISLLMACSNLNQTTTKNNPEESFNKENITTIERYDESTYQYSSDNNRFTVVAVERIKDGTSSGITISTLVDRNTKVMYMLTEKFQAGYGISFDVILNAEGTPLIYNGELK